MAKNLFEKAWIIALCWQILLPKEIFNIRVSVCIKHYSQKIDFSDYNGIIAPLDKLIMLHYYSRYMESIEHYCFMELESYKHFTFIWLLLSDIIFHWLTSWLTNIDKGTMAPMVACFHQNNSLKVMSQFGQTSTSASKTMPNVRFKILTKIQLQILDQSAASKTPPNFGLKVHTDFVKAFWHKIGIEFTLKLT